MRIVFQTPGFGESERDYRWGLVDAGGDVCSTWASPEAAFIEAANVMSVDVATLELERGPVAGTFYVRRR